MVEYSKQLAVHSTSIEGLLVLDLPVHGDNRGWFKENFQRQKMTIAGLPDLKIVQNNISFNAKRGVTRGIHAEPWDKYISVATGEIFGAWVDLRAGSKTYGKVYTTHIDPSKAIFVPRGVGNSFQALEDNTAYTYLVNDHWSADLQSEYTFVNLADPALEITWPIPLDSPEVEVSDKDKAHPMLQDVDPMKPKKTLVIGANGQLGRAVRAKAEQKAFSDTYIYTDQVADEERGILAFDATDDAAYAEFNWSQIGTIINCAAYTAVDEAETLEGRRAAWKINAQMPLKLARIATQYSITLVHISSDYVFDGELCDHPAGVPCDERCRYTEESNFAPLGVYAQTKAAGDIAVASTPKHFIVRTSWVVGDGANFVKTMQKLAAKDVKPKVVCDQFGRLTFTNTLADGIFHLLERADSMSEANSFNASTFFGTYNLTNAGRVSSWSYIAKKVYELCQKNRDDVTPVSTHEYFKNTDPVKPIAPRPINSALSLDKIESTGFVAPTWEEKLEEYIKNHPILERTT